MGQITRPANIRVLIINPALLTIELGLLTLSKTLTNDYLVLSYHQLICFQWDNIGDSLLKKKSYRINWLRYINLVDIPDKLKSAYMEWIYRNQNQNVSVKLIIITTQIKK